MAKASTTNRRPRLIAVAAVASWSRCRRTVTLHFRRSGFRVCRADREAGFTLVEVIVALAMLSLGLGLVLELVSNGLGRISSAEKMMEAGSRAQSLLSEAGTEFPIRPQWRDGQYPGGYRWHLEMQPYDKGDPASAVSLYLISAKIEWDEGSKKRTYVLTTLRLGRRVARS